MADYKMDEQKLAYFQDITGVQDSSLSLEILDAYGWDLDAAVSAMVDKNTNEIPEYRESMRKAAIASSDAQAVEQASNFQSDLGLMSTNLSPGEDFGRFGFESTPFDYDRYMDDRTMFERIGNEQNPLDTPSNVGDSSDEPNLLWAVVTLPFSILRGSLGLMHEAVGFGLSMTRGVLNAGLGALGLTGAPNRAVMENARQPDSSLFSGAFEAAKFLKTFKRQYGDYHPAFQAVSFMEALRRAGQEFKFLFVYLHSTEHMDTPLFCGGTLCNKTVVKFINQHFIAWGGDVRESEGYQMSNSLKASTFPFCAVVMGSFNMRIAVLQQVEGFQSAGELLSILQELIKEHGPALLAGQAEQDKCEMNRRLRDEQDEAYLVGLQIDQARDRRGQAEAGRIQREQFEGDQKRIQDKKRAAWTAYEAEVKEAGLDQRRQEIAASLGAEPDKARDVTQVSVRLPTGDRQTRRFESTCKVQGLKCWALMLRIEHWGPRVIPANAVKHRDRKGAVQSDLRRCLCWCGKQREFQGREKESGVASEEAEEERACSRRRLRAEQDAEYQAALLDDQVPEVNANSTSHDVGQERDNRRQQKARRAARKKKEEDEAALVAAKAATEKEAALNDRRRQKPAALAPEPEPGPDIARVRIRLPNGEHRQRRFPSSAPVQAVYDYVDTLMCFDVLSYSLLSSFPHVVYGPSTRVLTLKAVGFVPHASLFVQVDDNS